MTKTKISPSLKLEWPLNYWTSRLLVKADTKLCLASDLTSLECRFCKTQKTHPVPNSRFTWNSFWTTTASLYPVNISTTPKSFYRCLWARRSLRFFRRISQLSWRFLWTPWTSTQSMMMRMELKSATSAESILTRTASSRFRCFSLRKIWSSGSLWELRTLRDFASPLPSLPDSSCLPQSTLETIWWQESVLCQRLRVKGLKPPAREVSPMA